MHSDHSRPAVAARRLAQRLSAALGEPVAPDDDSIGRAARRAGWARPKRTGRLEGWIAEANREDERR